MSLKKTNSMQKKGKLPVKKISIEREIRSGEGVPLVMMYGQGLRQGVVNVNVPIPKALDEKLRTLTVGAKGQIVAILANYGLEQLEEKGECLKIFSEKD